MKHCNSCGNDKRKTEFGNRKASIDGLSAKCKVCQSSYDKRRANNPDRVKARLEYAKTDRGVELQSIARKKWAANNKGKIYESTRSYRDKYPVKYKAHGMVAYAIKVKNLVAKPCEICRNNDVHAHHDDYNEPLNVRWLCTKHHNQWHKENGEGLNG